MVFPNKFICLTLGWAVLLVAGLYLTAAPSAAPAEAAKAKQDRQVARARSNYVRCLTLSYTTGHRSGAKEAEVTNACAREAGPARAAFIQAGFPVPRAQREVAAIAAATFQEMLILIPPCRENNMPAHMS
jgi:hypothetical protein